MLESDGVFNEIFLMLFRNPDSGCKSVKNQIAKLKYCSLKVLKFSIDLLTRSFSQQSQVVLIVGKLWKSPMQFYKFCYGVSVMDLIFVSN